MGKTSLIENVFSLLGEREPSIRTYRIDINGTCNLSGFVSRFAAVVYGQGEPLTGPSTFPYPSEGVDPGYQLKEIFSYLEKKGQRCVIALDEFQQITEYPEKGVEALLRSYIQFLPNVSFIFSGSRRHLMIEMFSSPKRPFYQSTQPMSLLPIGEEKYYLFASSLFSKAGKELPEECFGYVYGGVMGHTRYVQCWLNKVYEFTEGTVTKETVRQALYSILLHEEDSFCSFERFLTSSQKNVLRAIACEGTVSEPYAVNFLRKYSLPATSTVRICIKTLVEKEFLVEYRGEYSVYNKFFMYWLRMRS